MAAAVAQLFKRTFLPVFLPLTLTILFTNVPSMEKALNTALGITPLAKKKGDFFTSKEAWAQFGLLFLMLFMSLQLFVFPLIPGVGPQVGKFTRITPFQVPAMILRFILYGYVPLTLSQVFVDLSKETDPEKMLSIRKFGLMVSFFLMTFVVQNVKILDIVLTIILYFVFESQGILTKLLKLFSTKQGSSPFAKVMTLLFLFGLITTTTKYLPMYDKLNEKVNARVGLLGEGVKGGVNHLISIALFLMLPLAVSTSLESTTTKMKTLPTGEGLKIGWLVGTMTALLVQNITGKTIQVPGGSLVKTSPGMAPSK